MTIWSEEYSRERSPVGGIVSETRCKVESGRPDHSSCVCVCVYVWRGSASISHTQFHIWGQLSNNQHNALFSVVSVVMCCAGRLGANMYIF